MKLQKTLMLVLFAISISLMLNSCSTSKSLACGNFDQKSKRSTGWNWNVNLDFLTKSNSNRGDAVAHSRTEVSGNLPENMPELATVSAMGLSGYESRFHHATEIMPFLSDFERVERTRRGPIYSLSALIPGYISSPQANVMKIFGKNDLVKIDNSLSMEAGISSSRSLGKSQLVALLLAIFLGGLGIHRFYLGYTTIGIIQLLTLGGCGIWALIDIIRIAMGDLQPKDGRYTDTL